MRLLDTLLRRNSLLFLVHLIYSLLSSSLPCSIPIPLSVTTARLDKLHKTESFRHYSPCTVVRALFNRRRDASFTLPVMSYKRCQSHKKFSSSSICSCTNPERTKRHLTSVSKPAKSEIAWRLEPEQSIPRRIHANISPKCTPAHLLARTQYENGKQVFPQKIHQDSIIHSLHRQLSTHSLRSCHCLPLVSTSGLFIPKMHGSFRMYTSRAERATNSPRRPYHDLKLSSR